MNGSILCFGDLLHLQKDHGRDFLRSEFLPLAEVVDFDQRCTLAVIYERERPLFSILDNFGIIESTTNQTSTKVNFLFAQRAVKYFASKIVFCGLRAA